MDFLPEYRAWHIAEKKMYRVVALYMGEKQYSITIQENESVFSMNTLPAKDFVLLPYTGLKDKGGTKIFAGDMLFRDSLWEVLWSQHESGMWGWMAWNDQTEKVYELDESILSGKIIGNVFEGKAVQSAP